MRKIEKIPLPIGLQKQLADKIANGRRYEDLKTKQRQSIIEHLLVSQKYLCCYCEKEVSSADAHIEHFFEQAQIEGEYRTLDYQDNLLASCVKVPPQRKENETQEEREERREQLTCGHKKTAPYHDSQTVDYRLLLNPMEGVTELLEYLIDGTIEPSAECSAADEQKVHYTIRRLNLHSRKLIQSRIAAIEGILEFIQELSPDELRKFLLSLLDETQEKLPAYYSCLKNNFAHLLNK